MGQEADDKLLVLRPPQGRKRRNLVVVAGGDGSQHTKWIADLPEAARSWDLALSHYGDAPPDMAHTDLVVRQKGFKYDCLARMLQRWPWLYDYDYIWLVDDDIQTRWSDIERRFELMASYQLDLAQPSLSDTSYILIPLCKARPEYQLRYTNFIEVMAPIFSRTAFRRCAPTFALSPTGHWLDWVWPKLLGHPRSRMAMLDGYPVDHLRACGLADSPAWKYVRANMRQIQHTIAVLLEEDEDWLQRKQCLEFGYILKQPLSECKHPPLSVQPRDERITPRLLPLLKQAISHPIAPAWQDTPVWQQPRVWTGGPPLTEPTPPLTEETWCLSLGVTINMDPACATQLLSGYAFNLLFLGEDPHESPFSIQICQPQPDTSQQSFTLNRTMQGQHNFQTRLSLSGIPFGQDVHFGAQIYPQAGWICTWINKVRSRDYWYPPFRFNGVQGAQIGNKWLQGSIRNFWLAPVPAEENA